MKRDYFYFRMFCFLICFIFAMFVPLYVMGKNNVPVISWRGADASHVAHVKKYYKMAPDNVRHRMIKEGWKVKVSGKNLASLLGYGGKIMGLTRSSDMSIYIDCRCKADDTVLHEIGHIVDYYNGFSSRGNGFKKIWKKEKPIFVKIWSSASANTDTAVEYFGEAYLRCILSPSLMKKKCPRTFRYVMSCSGRL